MTATESDQKNEGAPQATPATTTEAKKANNDKSLFSYLGIDDELFNSEIGGIFRGITVAARAKLPIIKAASIKATRAVGTNRPLAFASEGAVAGNSLMPRWMYYGAWGLSGVAIAADITTRSWDAPEDKQKETAFYWTAFHVPASLVVPALIIHQVVHAAEHSLEHHSYAKKIPLRVRPFVSMGAALLAIIPVVPAVDHLAEMIMEPTLGNYLGLEFHHHHGDSKKED